MITDTLVPGGLKRGDDGGCQLREIPAVLPAGEQVDIATRPVPHPVSCDRVPAGQRKPVSRARPQGDPRYLLMPGFHRPAAYAVAVTRLISASTGNLCSHALRS